MDYVSLELACQLILDFGFDMWDSITCFWEVYLDKKIKVSTWCFAMIVAHGLQNKIPWQKPRQDLTGSEFEICLTRNISGYVIL